MQDGSPVKYIGPQGEDLVPGVRGRVLACTASYAHTQWVEGPRVGQVDLVSTSNLEVLLAFGKEIGHPNAVTASLDDSLEVGELVSVAGAEEAYEEAGSQGLVSHLASGGHLASYSSMAEEALQFITARLQQDGVLLHLTASMDPDEADEVYRLVARTLLSDSGDF